MTEPGGAEEPDDGHDSPWPVRGPATPQQALVAIAFIFFLGVVVGFVLSRTF
jgi:hypothetical protein